MSDEQIPKRPTAAEIARAVTPKMSPAAREARWTTLSGKPLLEGLSSETQTAILEFFPKWAARDFSRGRIAAPGVMLATGTVEPDAETILADTFEVSLGDVSDNPFDTVRYFWTAVLGLRSRAIALGMDPAGPLDIAPATVAAVQRVLKAFASFPPSAQWADDAAVRSWIVREADVLSRPVEGWEGLIGALDAAVSSARLVLVGETVKQRVLYGIEGVKFTPMAFKASSMVLTNAGLPDVVLVSLGENPDPEEFGPAEVYLRSRATTEPGATPGSPVYAKLGVLRRMSPKGLLAFEWDSAFRDRASRSFHLTKLVTLLVSGPVSMGPLPDDLDAMFSQAPRPIPDDADLMAQILGDAPVPESNRVPPEKTPVKVAVRVEDRIEFVDRKMNHRARIKELRERMGLSAETLLRYIAPGLSPDIIQDAAKSYVAEWEADDAELTDIELLAMASALRVPPAGLLEYLDGGPIYRIAPGFPSR